MNPIRAALCGGLVMATHNAGKVEEMRDLLANRDVVIRSAVELGLPEPAETGTTFAANARLKAEAAAEAAGMAALADDSGLVVDALGGAPGVQSARWAGPERDFSIAMNRVWLALRAKKPDAKRAAAFAAAFVSVLAFAAPGMAAVLFTGRVDGRIVWPPRGDGGFGYDPIFAPEDDPRSFAQMPFADKQAVSHRGRAIRAFLDAAFGDA